MSEEGAGSAGNCDCCIHRAVLLRGGGRKRRRRPPPGRLTAAPLTAALPSRRHGARPGTTARFRPPRRIGTGGAGDPGDRARGSGSARRHPARCRFRNRCWFGVERDTPGPGIAPTRRGAGGPGAEASSGRRGPSRRPDYRQLVEDTMISFACKWGGCARPDAGDEIDGRALRRARGRDPAPHRARAERQALGRTARSGAVQGREAGPR